jgi:hypothetical protein
MRRLLAVLVSGSASVILIVGSLSVLPGRTDADPAPVIPQNIACLLVGNVGPNVISHTMFIPAADAFRFQGADAATVKTQIYLPFITRNNVTGQTGTGTIHVPDVSPVITATFNLHESPRPGGGLAGSFERYYSGVMDLPSLGINPLVVVESQPGGPAFGATGSAGVGQCVVDP